MRQGRFLFLFFPFMLAHHVEDCWIGESGLLVYCGCVVESPLYSERDKAECNMFDDPSATALVRPDPPYSYICNEHGVYVYEECICHTGWTGPKCSIEQ